MQNDLKIFMELSVILTGFTQAELQSTGQAEDYFKIFNKSYPILQKSAVSYALKDLKDPTETEIQTLQNLIQKCICKDKKQCKCSNEIKKQIEKMNSKNSWTQLQEKIQEIYSISTQEGVKSLSSKIIKLWYTGICTSQDQSNFVNKNSYSEGLIWKTFHSHPPGHKQPGFGSWSNKPLIAK